MKILMISREAKQCGVSDYGLRLFAILKPHFDIELSEVNNEAEYQVSVLARCPEIILYNYHYATLGFITDGVIDRNIKHYAIFHEAALQFTPDKVLDTSIRPLFDIPFINLPHHDITVGSFGFGFPDKNFPRIAQLVKEQYQEATIRLNIPFAEYGDRDGYLAKREADKVRAALHGTNIKCEINHDYLSQSDLLSFLRGNTVNMFLYNQSHGRGLSSAIDYALSVKRPIGVSNSEMFRHLPKELQNSNIDYLINNSAEILKPVYEEHSNKRLIEKYKQCLE
jgi:hypothetical protein